MLINSFITYYDDSKRKTLLIWNLKMIPNEKEKRIIIHQCRKKYLKMKKIYLKITPKQPKCTISHSNDFIINLIQCIIYWPAHCGSVVEHLGWIPGQALFLG